jgi:hypothetical protein
MATGYGLRFSRTIHGGNPETRRFYVPSTDSTALYEGDVVKLVDTTGAMDPKAEVAVCTRAATGEIPLGVVVGFDPDSSALLTGNYRAASTNRYVNVCFDPDSVYIAQEDAVGGAITAALVGAMTNVDFIVASGSAVTGLSGTMIDSNTTTASAADLKVVGVPANGGDNYAAKSGGAELEVMLLGMAIRATDSQN